MSWQDKGLIFQVNNLMPWAKSHCYVPTAIELDDRIRVYVAFWDDHMHGRLGFVDVDKEEPTKVIDFSKKPIIEDASNGQFDCDGITPLSVIFDGEKLRLYYAGWQRFNDHVKRYTIFVGLAFSDRYGEYFTRYINQPVIGPRNEVENLRSGAFILFIDGQWRAWIASYERSIMHNNKFVPVYNLETLSSPDGLHWPAHQTVVFPVKDDEIMGYGRGSVWRDEHNKFHGLFPVRFWDGRYRGIYYTTSEDGIKWSDPISEHMGFSTCDTCDNQSEISFPSLIHQQERILMFYNGNDFGKEGLRLAIWQK